LEPAVREAVLAWFGLSYRERAEVVGHSELVTSETAEMIRLIDDLSESDFRSFVGWVRWH
jgi:hypothetical protein